LVLLGLLLLVFAHVAEGGHLQQLIQTGAFLVSFVLPAAAAGLVYRGALPQAIDAALSDRPMNSTDALRWVGLLRSTRSMFVAGGCLGTLLGLSTVLRHIDDPSKLGAGIAVSWLACFYMVVIAELFLAPMIRQLAVRGLLPNEDLAQPETSRAGRAGGALLLALALSGGLILAAHVVEGGLIEQLTQPGAVLLITLSGLFAMGWHGPTALKRAILFAPSEDSRQEDLQVGLQVLLSLRTAIYAMAAIGYLLAHIHIMAHLDDPKQLGAGFAVATVVWIMAILVAELVLGPQLLRLKTECSVRRGAEGPLEQAARSDRIPNILLVASVVVMTVLALYSIQTFT